MAKTSKLSKIFVILLFVVVAAALTFAFVNVPIGTANAEEEPFVLKENTAEYEFINEGEHQVSTSGVESNPKKFKYNKDNNEWTISEAGTLNNTIKELTISFKFKIVKEGKISFQYKLNSASYNKSFEIKSTNPDFKGLSLVGTTTDPTKLDPDKDTLNSEYYVGNTPSSSYPNYPGNKPGDNRYSVLEQNAYLLQYGDQTTFTADVKADDVITILYTPGGNAAKYNNFSFRGLNIPSFKLTAKVADGQSEFGKVVADREDEQVGKTELTVSRNYFDDVTFTAQPIAGYIAYWKDTDGKFVSMSDTLTIHSIDESYTNAVYIACFEKLSDGDTQTTFDEPSEENYNVGWKTTDDRTYTMEGISGFTQEESVNLSSSLTWIVYGEHYLKFSYQFLQATNGKAKLMLTIDEKQSYVMKKDKDGVTGLATTGTVGETQNFSDIYLWIGEGYHIITWTFTYEGKTLDEGTSCIIKDLSLSKQPYGTEEFEVTWNPHLAKMYLDGVEQVVDTNTDKVVTTVTLSWGKPLIVGMIKRAKTVNSSITGEEVSVSVAGNSGVTTNFTNSDKGGTSGLYDNNISYRAHIFAKCDESGAYRVGNSLEPMANVEYPAAVTATTISGDYTLQDGEDHVKINYMTGFREALPVPQVTATVQKGGAPEQIEITKNQLIQFTYGQDNSFTGQIKTDYNGRFKLNKDYLSVIVDGVALNSLQDYVGIVGFVLNDVSRHTINVTYKQMPEYFYSSNSDLTFKVEETDDNGIEGIVRTGNVSISDIGTKAWMLDFERATVDNIAYKAGAEVIIDANGKASGGGLSELKFLFGEKQERGILTFEFQMDGAANTISLGGTLSFTNIGAQLFTKFDEDFKGSISNAADGEGTGGYAWSSEPGVSRLAWASDANGGMDKIEFLSDSVTRLANGWFRAKITVESTQNALYLAFVSDTGVALGGDPHASFLTLRNVNFLIGNASLDVNANSNSAGSFNLSKGDQQLFTSVRTASLTDLTIGDIVTLTANLSSDEKVYGWFVDDQFYSNATEIEYEVIAAKTNIEVLIHAKKHYAARIGKEFYETLETAISVAKAGEDKSVIIVDELEISNTLEIPSEVTLILPHDANGAYFTSGTSHGIDAQNRTSWATDLLEQKYKKYTLTIKENATVTVYGTFIIGGVIFYPDQSAQGHTSGAYSELILEKGSKIEVASGGVMDVYGRVWSGKDKSVEEMGTINVAEGGKLYEPFLILDFPGGSYTLDIFMQGLTPFRRYAMINIECPMTINYGGQLIGHAGLYALGMLVTLDQPFISDENGDGLGRDTMIMLKPGTSVKITYDPTKYVETIRDGKDASTANNTELIGQTTLEFNGTEKGGAMFSYMQFTALGITIPTSSVSFSIPYNFHLKLAGEKALYETCTDFSIMPGAIVEVCEGATLHLHANATVYDGLVQGALAGKSYPTAEELHKAGYSKNGNLIVNGQLIIDKKWSVIDGKPSKADPVPSTFLGIIQTDGTGTIEIKDSILLYGKVIDGLKGETYFEYATTARVWDVAHNCFGNLAAGHTYTATGSAEFHLEIVQYTITPGGQADGTLDLTEETLHGSWMEVHEGHKLDWTPDPEKDALTGNNTVISRQCSVMGCNHTEEKYLLKDASAFETQIYKGSAFSADDLRALFLKMFGLQEDGLLEGFDVKFQFKPLEGGLQNIEGQLKNVPSSAYQIAVTLTNGVWLEGGVYVSERTFTFDIDPYTLTGLTAEITVDEAQEGKLPSKEYTSRQLTYGDLTVKFKGQQLALSKDYTIKNGGNINVAEGGTVTIEGTGNFAGSFELKFDITAVDISGGKLSVQGTEFVYNGQAQTPRREQLIIQGVAGFDNSAITVEINASNNIDAGTASVTVTGTGNFTGTTQAAEYNIGKKNIEITLKAQTTEYTGEAQEPHSSEGDWSFEAGAICSRDGKQDELNIQIKLARGEAIGAADYDLTFSFENDNYNVTRKAGDSAKFTIEQKSIEGATVSIKEGKTYTFNGGDITPADVEVEVTLEGWDKPITFTVSATENRNKGTAKFTVSGTGNYKGTSEQGEFEIKAAPVTIKVNDLSSALGDNLKTNYGYSVSAGQFYGEDETIFQNNIINKYACTADNTHISDEQHQYKITLDVAQAQAALPNYEITVTEGVYTVNDSVFKDVVFEAQNVPYDGQGHKLTATSTPEGAEIEYKYQAGEAPAGDAWQDIPEGGFVNAGKYSIRVTITLAEHESKYQETRLLTIDPKDISGATVTVEGEYTYTGSAITVEETNITVTLADWSLQIDFDIDNAGYENNTDATTETKAVVKIKGTGNYTGEATGEFEIAKKSIAGGTLTVSGTYTYNGEAQTPDGEALSVTLEDFGEVTFRVKEEGGYDNNVNATTSSSKAKVTVEGTGNFEGELSALFEIGQAQVDKVEVQDADGYVYSGSDIEPQLVVKSGAIALRAGDYDIEYTNGDDGHKNAGTVTFKVVGKGNFKGEVSSNFTIKAKKITVRLLKQTTVYTGATPNVSSEQNVGWEVDEGAICGDDDLNIRLSAEGLTAAAKTYTVKPEFTNSNYEVEWDSETAVFEITPATITITVEDAYSTYGDVRATLNKRVDGICESDRSTLNIDDYVTLSCDVNERTGYGTYDITCTKKGADPANYTIQIANTGTYTVNKRDVTVNITDQNDTYNVTKNYRWNANAWEVDENTPLVNGDERTALGVQLARPALGNAGTYVITATYESDNYNVTFKGSWDGEDANNEKAGTYTIAKKRVTDNGEDVTFMISVGGDDWTHEDNLSVKYSGEAITLDAQVYVTESGDSSLGYTIDPEELTEIRIYTVTVAIDDINYEGSRTFTVEVLTAAGYSQALTDALDELEEIVGELTYDALTSSEEHFGIVKQVKAILDGLSEEDKQAGEEQLARYERLVETWQNAADLDDDVIETAKDIADSPIKWLFVMVAEVSALLAALYVVGKGGLM